ncbi:hypothetical protein [Chondromyces crocatus]|uniref:Uncharacterized protein n=1 Tax=Chondromyces crocatus TaxID=52 RepID=A0A0K1EG12_CHOCO|nr:hypothetical protein [Chondromyces crocatus]AKT39523.1 uncharacterized protein CMC5_036700 [Chondromyces crocatus]
MRGGGLRKGARGKVGGWLVGWAVVFAGVGAGRAVQAEPRPRVVILNADGADAVQREATTRLRAELRAAGFEVVEAQGAQEGARTAQEGARAGSAEESDLARAARVFEGVAAVKVARSRGGASVTLWLREREGRGRTRAVSAQGRSAPSVVAVRAVEELQASQLGVEGGARATEVEAGSAPEEEAARRGEVGAEGAAKPRLGTAAVEGGVGLLLGGGVGPAVGPFLRVSLGAELSGRPGEVLAARVTLAGPAFAPDLAGAVGSVSVRQELALVEVVYSLGALGPLVPRVSVGAGAYHLRAVGDPRSPYEATSGEVWAALVGAGAGVGWSLGERLSVVVDAQVLFAQPRPVVALAGERLGAPGRPSVGGFLGLLVVL